MESISRFYDRREVIRLAALAGVEFAGAVLLGCGDD